MHCIRVRPVWRGNKFYGGKKSLRQGVSHARRLLRKLYAWNCKFFHRNCGCRFRYSTILPWKNRALSGRVKFPGWKVPRLRKRTAPFGLRHRGKSIFFTPAKTHTETLDPFNNLLEILLLIFTYYFACREYKIHNRIWFWNEKEGCYFKQTSL